MLSQRGKAYPQELRERVFRHADAGMPVGAIARTLLVSVSYVSKVLGRRKTTGETAARAQCCHLVPRLHGHEARIRARVQARPGDTLTMLCAWLAAEHKLTVSLPLMVKTMAKLNLTHKKRRCTRPNRTARTWLQSVRRGGPRSPAST
jgi:transposase